MRRIWLFWWILGLGMTGAQARPNLVQNPGFEEGTTAWNLPPEVFTVDETVAYRGQRSLRLHNPRPEVYLLATQEIPFAVGRFYRLSVWIKTEDVQGEDSGATICLEWYKGDEYLGGSYPRGFKGTNDWQHLVAETLSVPPGTTQVRVVLYLRRGMTGTAWFDEVEVTPGYPPPLRTFLREPSYRGQFFADTPRQRALLDVAWGEPLPDDRPLTATELRLSLLSAATPEPLRTWTVKPQARREQVAIDLRRLPVGEYTLQVQLVETVNGEVLSEQRHPLAKLPPGAGRGRVYIDEYNRTIVDGQPFFPLGLYCAHRPASDQALPRLDEIAASPFNCLMNYGINSGSLEEIRAYLDAVHQRGLKIIYSLKDFYEGTRWYPKQVGPFEGEEEMTRGVVTTFKDHPALLAWYLNDELPRTMHSRLAARYDLVRRLDPDHPTWIVLYQVNELEYYLDTTDVLGTDPYPIPRMPISRVADWTRRTVRAVRGRRAVWMVPQLHNWWVYYHRDDLRPPTREEIRNMAFQCLVNGANGLIFYSFFDLKRDPAGFANRWADATAVAEEIQRLAPVLLSPEKAPPARLATYLPEVHLSTRRWGNNLYLLTVNTVREARSVVFRVPAGTRRVREWDTGTEVPLDGLTFRAEFPPLGVQVYVLEGKYQQLRVRRKKVL
ncbi:MAG TPA: hypothetical protein EYP85_13740 [Armatimonadetes bacterium]|nr:hypothetical protein [Armatimonadota bacterium]